MASRSASGANSRAHRVPRTLSSVQTPYALAAALCLTASAHAEDPWDISEDFVAGARAAVAALHRATNLDPQELFARLGIKPDLGNYKRIAALSG